MVSICIDLAPAWVLHTRAYRDTSLLVDLFTLDQGRLRCIARGVRGRQSKRKGLLQPFQPLLVSLVGRGELLTLTHAEYAAVSIPLAGRALFSGLYLNELLVRLLHPSEAHLDLYRAYQSALLALYRGEEEAALRWFEWQLLEELGYAINARIEVSNGEPINIDNYYEFSPVAGFRLLSGPPGRANASVFRGDEVIAVQAYMEHRRHISTIEQDAVAEPGVRFDACVANASKRLMRQALRPLLGERPLMTRTLFQQKLAKSDIPQGDGDSRLPPEPNKR